MLSLSLLEVINISATWKRTELPREKYAPWIYAVYLSSMINQFPLSVAATLRTTRMAFHINAY